MNQLRTGFFSARQSRNLGTFTPHLCGGIVKTSSTTQMENKEEKLSQLPSVDRILRQGTPEKLPPELFAWAVRVTLKRRRELLLQGEGEPPSGEKIRSEAAELANSLLQPHLRRVINATGVILHTGLGRAPLSQEARDALLEASGYCNLEFELKKGVRGERNSHIQSLLSYLTGAEASLVVNNNAAATYLTLNTLAPEREVIISRGELVEIGGSFRLPYIMEGSGATMREVGTTNRTALRDYEEAVIEDTALIMKVHQSNYRISGFTSQVELADLVSLGRSRGLPVVHDIGSGALIDLSLYGLQKEPIAGESIKSGADLVLFSGDKLLGGPQAGVILGKENLIKRLRTNQFYRAFRAGKLTLSALEATLRLFLHPEELPDRLPLLHLLTRSPQEVEREAKRLAAELIGIISKRGTVKLIPEVGQVGGGSLAGEELPTTCVGVTLKGLPAGKLAQKLRLSQPPIIPRVKREEVLLDLRSLEGIDEIVLAFQRIIEEG